MHEQRSTPEIGLVLIGFSPPERLAAVARHVDWPGMVLADQSRRVYHALGLGRAPLWQVYSPLTLLTYARALLRGQRLSRPVEDTRQLGGDAVVVNGTVVDFWQPRTPDDRPPAATVHAAASARLQDRSE